MQYRKDSQSRIRPGSRRNNPQVPCLVTRKQSAKFEPSSHNFFVNPPTTTIGLGTPHNRSNRPHIIPPHPEAEIEKPVSHRIKTATRTLREPLSIEHKFDTDKALDNFLNKVSMLPLFSALESFFKHQFDAKTVTVWQEIPNLQLLYCQSMNLTTPHSSGLVGYSFFSRTVVRTANGPGHPSFHPPADEELCPLNSPVLIFPLWDWKNSIIAIVEIVKTVKAPEFTQNDEEFVDWFTKKFKLLSRWIRPQQPLEGLELEVLQLTRKDDFMRLMKEKIAQYFNCRQCDIWKYDKIKQQLSRYTDKCEPYDLTLAGIAGDAISREQTVNCINCRLNNSYNPEIDGNKDEAILSVPVLEKDGQVVYSLVLRGPLNSSIFTKDDEDLVRRAAPVIMLGFTNAESFSTIDEEFQNSRLEREGLAALLEVVELLSSQLDTAKLTELIMEKGRELTKADRCSLFLVNENRDRLITSLHQGLENCIDMPINKGIAGKTVTEGKILNISDVYETDFFDSSTDLESGYRTRSILSVPIYNNRAEIIGVTEMVNKIDGKPFTQWDTKLIQIFNVFCGISLENARLYKESIDMSSQLRSFFDIAFTMSNTKSMQRLLSDIMQNARKSINAERASLFLLDDAAGALSSFLVDGNGKFPQYIPLTTGIAASCVKTKQGTVVNDAYNDPQFNRAIDNSTGYKTKTILASPIISSDGTVMGVAEMVNKVEKEFTSKDLQILNAFSTFASVALENSRLKDLAQFGDVEIEMNKWIAETERTTYDIPAKLQLTDQQKAEVYTINCYAVNYKGIMHFKELFYFMKHFDLFEKFKITNEMFFRFVFAISSTYNQVPYHNWTHACDVTQYVNYEIETAHLDQVYTSFEIFALLISAICHDANHEGLNNVFNEKAETPFGILFKNQSVMEMHHITVAIPIITKDEINLFHALNPDETKKMWNMLIKLILATDMAHHFELVKRCGALIDEDKWNWEDPDCRTLSLQLILKVADISNVSRPFDLADKWCDILCNEFFRQGDLEKSTGIGLTSPLNDREHPDKPKSQIGFYNFICLPLYQIVARVFPPLQVNVDSVKSNLDIWKSMVTPPPENK